MKKTLIAFAIATGLLFSLPSQAQNVAPVPDTAIVTLPIKAACLPIDDAVEMLSAADFNPLFRGNLELIRPEGTIMPANDKSRVTLWYNPKVKTLINIIWNAQRNIACVTHTVTDVTIDDSAWTTVGRVARADEEHNPDE